MKAERTRKGEKKAAPSSQRGRKASGTDRKPRRKKEDDYAPSPRRHFEENDDFSSRPRRKKEEKPLQERLKSEGGDDRRKKRREFFTERTENKPSYKRKRDFEDKPVPRRRFDNEDNYSKRPVGRPRKEDNRFGEREYRPRRDDDRRESPRRRFNNDEREERPMRSYKRQDNENQSYRSEKEIDKPKSRSRNPHLDSDILRDIMRKRRETGRFAERKPKVLSLAWNEDRGLIRLNKYIANSGICSRREADDLILAGTVTVNGKIVTELGTKIMPADEVRYEDKILQREKPIYILLNKPKDYITTTEDDRGRDNVMSLIEGACEQRVYPVGRLDRNTTGLLLFTNDGEMTKKLTHPRFGIKKIYQVELDKDLKLEDFELLREGIELEDGFMQPDELEYVDGKKVHEGVANLEKIQRVFDIALGEK